MLGTYYKTLYQNKSFTDFLIKPYSEFESQDSPYIHCRAKCTEYQKGTPLDLEGRYHDDVFFADKVSLPTQKKEDAEKLLYFLLPNLSTDIRKEILHITGKNLPAFFNKKDASIRLKSGLAHLQEGDYISKTLYKKLDAYRNEKELFELLVKYGLSIDIASHLKKGKITANKLKKDPYQIIYGIPIYKAEEIARDYCKISPFDNRRIRGYLSHVMEMIKRNGDTCISISNIYYIVNVVRKKSPIFYDIPIPVSILYLAIKKNDLFMTMHEINGKVWVYEKKIWNEETNLIFHIKRLQQARNSLMENVEIEKIEDLTGFHFNQGQKKALELLKTSGVKIVTGPPGSGKTALILGVIQGFLQKFPKGKIQLAATTGAASQVMKHSCGHASKTVHKLLDIRPIGDTITSRETTDPITADLVIVDEVSMMDLQVASCLFKAIRSGTLLVLVGDVDQLSSVGYGSILHDLIQSNTMEVYYLTEIMRQSGIICENVIKIKSGQTDLKYGDSFEVRKFNSYSEALKSLVKSVKIEKSLVLSPVKKDILGTENINDILQNKTNKFCFSYNNVSFYEKDRIIMTKTNYTKGYFNGDIGVIQSFFNGNLVVQFTDKQLILTKEDFEYISLAYCITIHKSQGSEADTVHVLLPDNPKNMLTKNMIYTAVTRTKKKVVIYSVNNSFYFGIKNIGNLRSTQLSMRLQTL